MFSHTWITALWMLFGILISWVLAQVAGWASWNDTRWVWVLVMTAFAAFITGVWFGREQYTEELKFRKEGQTDILTVLLTFFVILMPRQKNMDLIVPSIVAWVIAGALIYSMVR